MEMHKSKRMTEMKEKKRKKLKESMKKSRIRSD